MKRIAGLLCLFLLALVTPLGAAEYDVVVYGGTSGGVVAAVQAARMGHSVALIEPGTHLGGLSSGGLGATDTGNKSVIGGVSREFYQRVRQHYEKADAWKNEKPGDFKGFREGEDAIWAFEPHVAEMVFEQMIAEAKVPVFRQERLNRQAGGVTLKGQTITAIRMESGRTFTGKVFLDATYEGDLMAAAGVSYTVGRESRATYGEALNGVAKDLNKHKHLFVVKVDPYVVPGDPKSGLVANVHGGDPGTDGEADLRVQAYCFRMCMSLDPKNSVPFPKPEGYDEKDFELLFRNFEAGDLRIPFNPVMMPNKKTDTNNNCAFSTDYLGANYDYPEASYNERERIIADHERYQKGLMWSLCNHPRVPQSVRDHMARWGLAADEFLDNGNWPHQLYIREARRMVSDYVVTEKDCRRVRVAEDSVGLGSYNMDSHNVQRYVTEEGFAQNEGDVQESPGGPYVVSYRAIVPKKGEAKNLLVPLCPSASHIAFGSIRMEPVFMILGQSAATAAHLALEHGIAVQDVDYAELREILLKDKQVLDLPADAKPKKLTLKSSFPGVVVDDNDATLTGPWSTSSANAPFVEAGYRHDGNVEKGRMTAVYKASLKPGRYEVRVAYPVNGNRATNVPVTVGHEGGSDTVKINQRVRAGHDGLFQTVGTYPFGKEGVVTISNAGTDGYVILDAVQFFPVK